MLENVQSVLTLIPLIYLMECIGCLNQERRGSFFTIKTIHHLFHSLAYIDLRHHTIHEITLLCLKSITLNIIFHDDRLRFAFIKKSLI